MRILMIEGDQFTAKSLSLALENEGFQVHVADLGEEGIDLAKRYEYDAITLNPDMPDLRGVDILRRIRAAKVATPVLVLTGDTVIETRVNLLSLGADDCLVKPFHNAEFFARLRAIVRRTRAYSQSLLTIGDLVVNMDAKMVSVAGTPVHLTVKEYQMLEYLALRKGSTLSKSALIEYLYNGIDEPEAKIIDVFVCKLRKKLASAGRGNSYIATVWGAGYQISENPVAQLAAAA